MSYPVLKFCLGKKKDRMSNSFCLQISIRSIWHGSTCDSCPIRLKCIDVKEMPKEDLKQMWWVSRGDVLLFYHRLHRRHKPHSTMNIESYEWVLVTPFLSYWNILMWKKGSKKTWNRCGEESHAGEIYCCFIIGYIGIPQQRHKPRSVILKTRVLCWKWLVGMWNKSKEACISIPQQPHKPRSAILKTACWYGLVWLVDELT